MAGAMRRFGLAVAVVMLVIGSAGGAKGDISVPPGLGPGDEFRIMFVTSGSISATSTSINTYDSFVAAAAAAAGLTTFDGTTVSWQAIGSTSTVNANDADRLPVSSMAPIYLLDGAEVASSAAQLWSGSLLASPDINEKGQADVAYVWTGTTEYGFAVHEFGSPANWLGAPLVAFGESDGGSPDWINFGLAESTNSTFSVYGISSVMTVPTPLTVPEPSPLIALATAAITGVVIGLARGRRSTGSVPGAAIKGRRPESA